MAAPVVTLTPDQASYLPGAPIVVTVAVVDPDSASERIVLSGSDSQNNTVTVHLDITRTDPFTIVGAQWERTGQALAVDQTNMRVTGTVPSA